MPRIIVVGGGLSGLAAAYELQRLGCRYTLVEVKNRPGGGIITARQAGFVIDGGPFVFAHTGDWPLLAELGLEDALLSVGELAAFKNGTETLIHALTNRLTGDIMLRMAISGLGRDDRRYRVCLENGLALSADAVIVALPARYAGRLFYTLRPEVSTRLRGYDYEPCARVSLGYRREQVGDLSTPGADTPAAYRWTNSTYRAPAGHVLIQARVPFDPRREALTAALPRAKNAGGWPREAVVERVHYWPEADLSGRHARDRAEDMAAIEALLPDGVALVGSDYDGESLIARSVQSRAAARRVAAQLA